MDAILAGLETSGKVATIKSIAYDLCQPISVVEALVRSTLQTSSLKLQAIWGQQVEGKVILTSNATEGGVLRNENDNSLVLVAIHARPENDKGSKIIINDQLDGLREQLQNKKNTEFVINSLGPVKVDNLQFAPQSALASVVSASNDEELPERKSAGKTAVDFFRGPSPAAANTGSKLNKEPSITSKKNFFFSKKTEPEPESAKVEDVAIKQVPSIVKAVEPVVQDLDVSSSSEEEEEEENDVEDEEARETVETGTSADGKSKKERKATGSKKKRARVILSDDEDDEKSAAKTEARRFRSEQRRAERELQKQQEMEMKLKREAEDREEAKSGFLKQLGALPSSSGTMKKKVLKTRTFVDEEGFEVTEDVLEEVDVPIDEVSPNPVESSIPDKKADVTKSAQPSLPKSATLESSNKKSSRSPPTAKSGGGGKQASLTSFFSKKN